MYDKVMLAELQELKKGDNIYYIQDKHKNIKKIIKNRTQDKINFLNLLFDNKLIDINLYNDLLFRVQSDLRKSYLYIFGFINLIDLE